jgi:hypothetical protein
MIKRFINDLVGGSWTILGLLFAVVVLPEGPTHDTMSTIFLGLTLVWFLTGPLRWKDN